MDEIDPSRDMRAFFERVLEKLAQHPRYAVAVQRAAERERPLILNYHTHGPAQGYCVSICTRDEKLAVFGLEAPLEELAHIRGVAQREEQCDPLMGVFAARLRERFGVREEPLVFLNGRPR